MACSLVNNEASHTFGKENTQKLPSAFLDDQAGGSQNLYGVINKTTKKDHVMQATTFVHQHSYRVLPEVGMVVRVPARVKFVDSAGSTLDTWPEAVLSVSEILERGPDEVSVAFADQDPNSFVSWDFVLAGKSEVGATREERFAELETLVIRYEKYLRVVKKDKHLHTTGTFLHHISRVLEQDPLSSAVVLEAHERFFCDRLYINLWFLVQNHNPGDEIQPLYQKGLWALRNFYELHDESLCAGWIAHVIRRLKDRGLYVLSD
jgi:hypothetical protein